MNPPADRSPNLSRSPAWLTALIAVAAAAAGCAIGFLWRGRIDDPPAAVVNGVTIDMAQFAHRCIVASGPQVLDQIVNEELQVDLARNLGILPTNAQVEAKYDQAAKKPDFAEQLAGAGRTPADFRRQIYVALCQQNVVTRGVSVTDADALAFYRANTNPNYPDARYYQPDTVQVEVIVTTSAADHAAALAALASGDSFAAVAQRYSKDPSASNGGVVSPIRKGSLGSHAPPGFEKAVFSLTPGRQLNDFPAGKTVWIIRCLSKKAGFLIPYEQVKDECLQGAAIAKGLQTNGATLQAEKTAIARSATITVFWPRQREITARQ
jgi:parvulin-like peptidyl-prolyl isomerase